MLLAVEIVTIHTNPKRKRGNDFRTSLTLRVGMERHTSSKRGTSRGYFAESCSSCSRVRACCCRSPLAFFATCW